MVPRAKGVKEAEARVYRSIRQVIQVKAEDPETGAWLRCQQTAVTGQLEILATGEQWVVGQDLRAPTAHPVSMGGEEINSPRQEGRGVSTRGNRVSERTEVHVCVVGAGSHETLGGTGTRQNSGGEATPRVPGGCHADGAQGLTKKMRLREGRDWGSQSASWAQSPPGLHTTPEGTRRAPLQGPSTPLHPNPTQSPADT